MTIKQILLIEYIKVKEWKFLLMIGSYILLTGLLMSIYYEVDLTNYTSFSLKIKYADALKNSLTSLLPSFMGVFIFLFKTGQEFRNGIIPAFIANGISRKDYFLSKLISIPMYVFVFEVIKLLISFLFTISYYPNGTSLFFEAFKMTFISNIILADILLMSIAICFLFFTKNAAISIVGIVVLSFVERYISHKIGSLDFDLFLPLAFIETRIMQHNISITISLTYSIWCVFLWGSSLVWFLKRDL